jgi:RimJ/RimL family protein N-acetyltransferase
MSSQNDDVLEAYTGVAKLLDGTSIKGRALRCDDVDRLMSFVSRLSWHSRYLRFHHYISGLSEEEARRFCNLDYHDSIALVAVVGQGDQENIVAVGRYYRYPCTDRAEVAFVVEDKYQGKGIATHLLDELLKFARKFGTHRIEALVLLENREMQEVFLHRGFKITEYLEDSVIKMGLDIATSDE